MTIRWYVMPLDEGPLPNSVGAFNLVARYFFNQRDNPTGLKISAYSGVIYRYEKLWCGWAEVTPSQHATIRVDTKVLSAPSNIDNLLSSGDVTTISNFLESIKVPSQWVNASLSYRQVIRSIVEFFKLYQMLREILAEKTLFQVGITLDTQWQDMPPQFKLDAISLWQSQGFNINNLQPTTQLRAVLHGLIKQMSNLTFNLSGQIL